MNKIYRTLFALIVLVSSFSYAEDMQICKELVPEDDPWEYLGKCKSGSGIFPYNDGSEYSGEFKNGTWNGHGTMTYPSGMKYVGEWKNGKIEGQGQLITVDGDKQYIYKGEFKDNTTQGQGTILYPSGDRYIGEWKHLAREGQGAYIFRDGRKYVSQWKNDSPQGQGTMYTADGRQVSNSEIDWGKVAVVGLAALATVAIVSSVSGHAESDNDSNPCIDKAMKCYDNCMPSWKRKAYQASDKALTCKVQCGFKLIDSDYVDRDEVKVCF